MHKIEELFFSKAIYVTSAHLEKERNKLFFRLC